MADAKPIVVSMKMLADVKDADKLLKYVHDLGQQLKKAGGEDAEGLRRKLLEIKKQIYASDRTDKSTKAFSSQIQAMMPDITKANTIGSVNAIEAKLKSFGTAQAKAILSTTGKLKEALKSGDISQETFDMASKSLERFVEQAKKLPPPQMAKLGKDIRNLITNSQELSDAIEKVNNINFKIDLSGKGSVGELFQKMNIAEAAQSVKDVLDEAATHIEDFGEEGGKAFNALRDKMEKALSGNLGKDSIKTLKEIEKEAVKMGAALSGKELGKSSAALKNLVSSTKALEEELNKTGIEAVDSLGDATIAMDLFGLHTSTVEKFIVGLSAKIPWVAKALNSIPIMWVLAGIASIVKGIGDIWSSWQESIKQADDIKFKNAEDSLKSLTERSERWNFLLDLAISKERAMVSVLREQQDAMQSLLKAQNELNKEKAKAGLRTEAERNAVELEFDRTSKQLDAQERKRRIDRAREDNDREIAELEKRTANLRSEKKAADAEASNNFTQSAEELDQVDNSSYWKTLKTKKGFNLFRLFDKNFWTGHDAEAEGERFKGLGEEAQKKSIAIQQDILKNEQRIKELKDRQASFETAYQEEAATVEKEDIELKERQRIENERIEQILRSRAREQELFEYDENEARISYEKGLRDPWRNLNEQLAYAEQELKRRTDEENEASAQRKKIWDEFTASGRTEMNEKEDFLYRNATSDLTRARSYRYSEMSTIAQLRKQIHDRQFDESMTQYQRNREDADFQRSGQYNRANWAGRLRMDIERYREGKRMFDEAQAKIEADNNGTATLSPEQRRIVERNRDEGRDKMTSTRDAIRSAAMEGDTHGMSFIQSLFGHRNRLTAMGLGGDVANWDKETASNTRKLVEQNKELLKSVNKQAGGNFGWGL